MLGSGDTEVNKTYYLPLTCSVGGGGRVWTENVGREVERYNWADQRV